MKKTILIVGLALAAVMVLGVGVAFAQGPAPYAGNGPMLQNGGGVLHTYMVTAFAEKLGLKIEDIDEKDAKKLRKLDIIISNDEELPGINQINFYPNPNTGKFNLMFNMGNGGMTKITVIDTKGNIVFSEKLKDFSGIYDGSIDLSTEATGIYFLCIEQNNKKICKKLVLE